MDSSSSSRLPWVFVLLGLIAAVAMWTLRDDGAGPGQSNGGAIISSQRAAVDAMLATLPVKYQTDDDGRVTQLVARGPDMTDAVAVHLQELPDLKDLQLEGSALGSAGMQVIGRLSHLESLRLAGTTITDGDLQHLTNLKGLKWLFLSDCPIGDEGMDAIGRIGSLTLLDLDKTQVTDEGVKRLGELVELQKLYLTGTHVTGTGFAPFPETNALTLLKLNGTPLTAEGLDALRRFGNLQSLYLEGVEFDQSLLVKLMEVVNGSFPQLGGLFLTNTQLTDASVEPLMALAKMPNLGLVDLNGTLITKSAFKRLATETPEISYQVDYSEGDE